MGDIPAGILFMLVLLFVVVPAGAIAKYLSDRKKLPEALSQGRSQDSRSVATGEAVPPTPERKQGAGCILAVVVLWGMWVIFGGRGCFNGGGSSAVRSTNPDRVQGQKFLDDLPKQCAGSVTGDHPTTVWYRCDNGTAGTIKIDNGVVVKVE